jgi:hypothetical protein
MIIEGDPSQRKKKNLVFLMLDLGHILRIGTEILVDLKKSRRIRWILQ